MSNPFTTGRLARPAIQCTPPREFTPALARRIHVLHIQLESKRKALAFVQAQISSEWKNLLRP